jgi:hypothetical protein
LRITVSIISSGVPPDSSDSARSAARSAAVLLFGVPFPRPPRRSPGRDPRPSFLAARLGIVLFCYFFRFSKRGTLSWRAFAAGGLLLDPILPSLSVVLTYGSCVIWLYRDEQRRRRQVREAFGRHVAPAVVARLAEDPGQLVLGGETRSLSIMFCDVRGFTSLDAAFRPAAATGAASATPPAALSGSHLKAPGFAGGYLRRRGTA